MQNRYPPLLIIILILVIVGLKTFAPKLFDRQIVKGESFSARTPAGWTVKKDKHEITFISFETDIMTGMPVAIFSIYAEKQKGALFMDDLWPELLESMKRENGQIVTTGVELIDRQQAKWILFRYNQPEIAAISLYIADDFNRLTRIQFVASHKKFKEYGKVFDDFKKSIELK